MIGPTDRKSWLTFGGDPVPDTDSGSLFHFPEHCEIGDLGDLLAVLVQSLAGVHDTRRNDWRRQDNESTTFWSDPADIRIPIRINQEIRIQIPDHFRLRLDALAEDCALWALSSFVNVSAADWRGSWTRPSASSTTSSRTSVVLRSWAAPGA